MSKNDVIEEDVSTDVDSVESGNASKKKLVISAIIAFVVAAVLGVVYATFVVPAMKNNEAKSILSGIGLKSGDIVALNTELVTFKGQSIAKTNVNQKSLAQESGISEDSAVFVFGNGKSSENKKTVDVYIDFNSQKSRDFILVNQEVLKGMVESGSINLRVHPVPQGSAFSMYAPEALAESFAVAPSRSWSLFIDLLKLSAILDTNKTDEILELIVEKAEENGIKDISAESIANGTFASWIITVGDDPQLATGYYPPIVYVDGSEVNLDVVNLNNPDSFRRAIIE